MSIFGKLFGLRDTRKKTLPEPVPKERDRRKEKPAQAPSDGEKGVAEGQVSPPTSDTDQNARGELLREAIRSGDATQCRKLVTLYPEIVNDESPLQMAVGHGQTAIVKLLLDQGADVHAKAESGFTPLHYGAMERDPKIAALLLEAHADPNARTDDGRTPLHMAHYREVAQILIDSGADIHARNVSESTPLHVIAKRSSEKASIAELLLSRGADANSEDNCRQTPLQWAAYNFHPNVVRTLLEHGADPNAEDEEGHTALFYASRDFRGDEVFVLSRNPEPEAIHEILGLLRKHKGTGEQESCKACGGLVEAPPRTEPRIITCTCGGNIGFRDSDIDKVKGVMILHSECGKTLYFPPTVWCEVCQRNFVPNWTSLIVADRAAEAARELTDPDLQTMQRLARELILVHGDLVEVRCVQGPNPCRIELAFADGTKTVITEPQGTTSDITWMKFGYAGQGPKMFHTFLNASGYDVTYEEVIAMKPGSVLRH